MNPKKITIIGFGRFGQTLYRLIQGDFDIVIYNKSSLTDKEKSILDSKSKIAKNLDEAYGSDVIFFCVPISLFENVIKEQKKYFRPEHVLIDVLSVKVHPKKIFEKHLAGTKTQAILTHPMFGPDSSKQGFDHLPFIINKFKSEEDTYQFWKNYFESKKLNVIEMTPEEHDRLAANSQGITHFIGRLLEKLNLKQGPIDSLGTKKLLEIKDQTCNDTWQLFTDLQTYNPYTKSMRMKLGKVYDELYNELLPKRVNKNYVVFGIQGGIGSFNEEAIIHYVSKEKITNYKIKYLYTTKNVLESLHKGEIDFGQFAISNAKGGLVHESIEAIPGYKFHIVAEFDILVKHFLMKRKDVNMIDVKTIMAHPQVFAQCEQHLQKKYPEMKLRSGTGELIDTAKAAMALFSGKIPKDIAVLGARTLAEHYNFDIIDSNLQDKQDNLTKFLVVQR